MLHNKRNGYGHRGLLLLAAVLVAMTIATACGSGSGNNETGGTPDVPGADSGNVIATYTGGEVTQEEFDQYTGFFSIMNPQYGMLLGIPQYQEQFLREYIGYKVLYTRAPDELKEETNTEADAFETELTTAIGENESLKTQMDETGLTVESMKTFYHLVVTVMKDAEANVTDEQVEAEYNNNPGDHTIVSVRHVLVSTTDAQTQEELRTKEEALARALEAKDKLAAGDSWDAVAAEYSDDPGSKDNGGLYADMAAGGWVPEFKAAALTQPIGEIGEPVESQFGYHVMQVDARQEKAFADLDEATLTTLRQKLAGQTLGTFMSEELPDLILSINLPQPEPEEGAGEAGAENGATGEETGSGTGENGTAGESDETGGAEGDAGSDTDTDAEATQ